MLNSYAGLDYTVEQVTDEDRQKMREQELAAYYGQRMYNVMVCSELSERERITIINCICNKYRSEVMTFQFIVK